MKARCNDCGQDRILTKCQCGADTCAECHKAYHSKVPKMGCAYQAGRKLLEEITAR